MVDVVERGPAGHDDLYRAHRDRVDIVSVPRMGYVVVSGRGDPKGPAYSDAVRTLLAVSFRANFQVRKMFRQSSKVQPLETVWWVDDPEQHDIMTAVALGRTSLEDSDRSAWQWQAMIMQPAPVDEQAIRQAIEKARTKSLAALDRLHYVQWEEGLCAQTLHVGPYAEEEPTIVALHRGLAEAGYSPRGRHHEIYLGNPRRTAPERLRTILRHPVEPA